MSAPSETWPNELPGTKDISIQDVEALVFVVISGHGRLRILGYLYIGSGVCMKVRRRL